MPNVHTAANKQTNKQKKKEEIKSKKKMHQVTGFDLLLNIPIFVRQFQKFDNFIEQHRNQRSEITRSQIVANKLLTHRFKPRIEAQLLLTAKKISFIVIIL